MSVTLDEHISFDERQLAIKIGSLSRDSLERALPGLHGVLNIDLGQRGRTIKQTGTLRAKSRTRLNDMVNEISTYMDGDAHTLLTGDGEAFDNLRMDSFNVSEERADGTGIVVDYEITYTQLV